MMAKWRNFSAYGLNPCFVMFNRVIYMHAFKRQIILVTSILLQANLFVGRNAWPVIQTVVVMFMALFKNSNITARYLVYITSFYRTRYNNPFYCWNTLSDIHPKKLTAVKVNESIECGINLYNSQMLLQFVALFISVTLLN